MRPAARMARLAGLALLIGVASCATVGPRPVSIPTASAPGAGTVLAVRPILARSDSMAIGGGWRAMLLNGVADAAPAPADSEATGPRAEFIVREDGGATVSIVQPDAKLQVGDRVLVTHPAASAARASLAPLL